MQANNNSLYATGHAPKAIQLVYLNPLSGCPSLVELHNLFDQLKQKYPSIPIHRAASVLDDRHKADLRNLGFTIHENDNQLPIGADTVFFCLVPSFLDKFKLICDIIAARTLPFLLYLHKDTLQFPDQKITDILANYTPQRVNVLAKYNHPWITGYNFWLRVVSYPLGGIVDGPSEDYERKVNCKIRTLLNEGTEEAEHVMKQLLEQHKRMRGLKSHMRWTIAKALAFIYITRGKLEQAKITLREDSVWHDFGREIHYWLGPAHIEALLSFKQGTLDAGAATRLLYHEGKLVPFIALLLGHILRKQGDCTKALELHKHFLELWPEWHQDYWILSCLPLLADTLANERESIQIKLGSLTLLDEVHGSVRVLRDDQATAETLYHSVAKRYEESFGPSSWHTLRARCYLFEILLRRGALGKARDELSDVPEKCEKALGQNHGLTIIAKYLRCISMDDNNTGEFQNKIVQELVGHVGEYQCPDTITKMLSLTVEFGHKLLAHEVFNMRQLFSMWQNTDDLVLLSERFQSSSKSIVLHGVDHHPGKCLRHKPNGLSKILYFKSQFEIMRKLEGGTDGTFPKFQSLPVELRKQIWIEALRRTVLFFPNIDGPSVCPNKNTRINPLLHACKESRAEAQKAYTSTIMPPCGKFIACKLPRDILPCCDLCVAAASGHANLKYDTVFFSLTGIAHQQYLVHFLEANSPEIRYLAIRYTTTISNETVKSLSEILRVCKKLREITVLTDKGKVGEDICKLQRFPVSWPSLQPQLICIRGKHSKHLDIKDFLGNLDDAMGIAGVCT